MPIDLTQPASGSPLSSAVIRSNFAAASADIATLNSNVSGVNSSISALNTSLAGKMNTASPTFTGDIKATNGGGYIAGIGGSGGYFVAQGNGASLFVKPAFDWIDFGSATNEGAWSAWVDTGALHFSAVNDAFSASNDFMTVTRALTVPRLALNFGTDAQGTYPLAYTLNVTDHFGGNNVDGVRIGAGGKTWGYLVNTQKGNGWNVPQLYIHNFPFGAPNGWNAPIRFENTTSTGNNRAISIETIDTSTTGALNVTSIEVVQTSPADRGGDTSGIFVSQSGGGNGISVYHLPAGAPANTTGFAIEARSNGTATCAYVSAVDGAALGGEVTGSGGRGVEVWYKDAGSGGTATTSNRAFKVRDFANTTENFFVQFDGTIFSKSGITTSSTTLHTTAVALSNAAAAATATMTNAPVAGNPTKWVSINDNGTVRRIPAW